jgi:GDPmannose 4,6-dehydratase
LAETLISPDTIHRVTKRALITGITGQDGSYLADYLLGLGYEVHGLVRRVALEAPDTRFSRITHLLDRVTLHPASLESYPSIFHVLSQHDFDECYHLAAQSFVAESFADGFSTMNMNINGTHYVLAALRESLPKCRFYFAGSSEMFGNVDEVPQKETTHFQPRSPYGISKVAGFHLTRNYREAYGLHCTRRHFVQSRKPRRGFEFVSRKITSAVARIKLGLASELRLGNLEAKRDWGHAADYVRAMHSMLQLPKPDDFVSPPVRRTASRALRDRLRGSGSRLSRVRESRPALLSPTEVDQLIGDASKAIACWVGNRHIRSAI